MVGMATNTNVRTCYVYRQYNKNITITNTNISIVAATIGVPSDIQDDEDDYQKNKKEQSIWGRV